jgi:hypothetical protein
MEEGVDGQAEGGVGSPPMGNEQNMIDAATQMAAKRGPYYVKYLYNSREGFLREAARLEVEIIRLQEEEDLANQAG